MDIADEYLAKTKAKHEQPNPTTLQHLAPTMSHTTVRAASSGYSVPQQVHHVHTPATSGSSATFTLEQWQAISGNTGPVPPSAVPVHNQLCSTPVPGTSSSAPAPEFNLSSFFKDS